MSVKYFCDSCGKEMEDNRYNVRLKNYRDSLHTGGVEVDRDICVDCYKGYKRYILKGKEYEWKKK